MNGFYVMTDKSEIDAGYHGHDMVTQREMIDAFHGKVHLYFLYHIIRTHQNFPKEPCKLTYKQMGKKLAKMMGRLKPYPFKTISEYMRALRQKGWVISIHFMTTIRGPIGGDLTRSRFFHFVRLGETGEIPIIAVVFAEEGVLIRAAPRVCLNSRGPIHNGTCISYTTYNIIPPVAKLLGGFSLTQREIKGITHMIGFFLEDMSPNKEEVEVTHKDATLLRDTLLQVGIGKGTKISIRKWAKDLAKTKRMYPEDYESVFTWVIENLPTKEWLRRSIQSAAGFHRRFDSLREWRKPRTSVDIHVLPDDFYEEDIDAFVVHIRCNKKLNRIPVHELKYFCWELFEWVGWVTNMLENIEAQPTSIAESFIWELKCQLTDLSRLFAHAENYLLELTKWDKFKGRVANTKLSISKKSPKGMEFLQTISATRKAIHPGAKQRVLDDLEKMMIADQKEESEA